MHTIQRPPSSFLVAKAYRFLRGNVELFKFSARSAARARCRFPFPKEHIKWIVSVSREWKRELRPDITKVKSNSKAIVDLIQRCWNGDPDERPDFTEIVSLLREPDYYQGYLEDTQLLDEYDLWIEEESKRRLEILSSIEDTDQAFTRVLEQLNSSSSQSQREGMSKLHELGNEHGPAALFLGDVYENGKHGVTRNYTKALEYYRVAAYHNIPEAYAKIGECYLCGRGVRQDVVVGRLFTKKGRS